MPSTFDRFYLGGIDTVRGYDLGSASGNQGAAMQLEVRRRINGLSDQPAEVYAFVDSGHVRAPELSKTLYSVGAGSQCRLNQHLALDLMLTRQLSSHALAQAQATNRAIMRLVASY